MVVKSLSCPLEIGAGIVAKAVGAFEESSIEVGLGSAEVERGSVAVFAKWRVFLVDLFHGVQQRETIILQQTSFDEEGTFLLLLLLVAAHDIFHGWCFLTRESF